MEGQDDGPDAEMRLAAQTVIDATHRTDAAEHAAAALSAQLHDAAARQAELESELAGMQVSCCSRLWFQ